MVGGDICLVSACSTWVSQLPVIFYLRALTHNQGRDMGPGNMGCVGHGGVLAIRDGRCALR